MTLHLTSDERAMLDGQHGPAVRMAMSILVRMAEASDAERFIEISAAHIDGALYMGEATLEFAERLANLGARVAVPSTLNVSGLDEHNWQRWPVPAGYAANAARQMPAYRAMGCIPTWTCTPYHTSLRPKFGQQIAWGESNAIAFANSVIGARTERYPDLLDICAAIAGRAPAIGLHLEEKRAGQVLFRLVDIPPALQADDLFYPILGILVGKTVGDRIPVIDGLRCTPTENQLKSFCAAVASAGGVGLFHLVGITPEAPTLRLAFHGQVPEREYSIDLTWLQGVYKDLNTASNLQLDMVAIGCPHFSLDEFARLARLVKGQKCHPDVLFLIATNREMAQKAEQAGCLEATKAFGARLVFDTCILTMPAMLPEHIKTIMTSSGKYAYYTPGMLDRSVYFTSLEKCVQSAIAGKVIEEECPWTR